MSFLLAQLPTPREEKGVLAFSRLDANRFGFFVYGDVYGFLSLSLGAFFWGGDVKVIFADYDAHVIKRVDSDGTVTSFLGQDFQCGGGSGDASTTRICAPKQIAADLSNGNVFWFEGRYVYGYNASDNQISVIYDGNQDNFQDWRVLIPISGYKNTTTTFYSSNIPPTKVESLIDGKHKQNYYTYDPKDCKIINQFSGEDIYSIDTTTIHSAENPSNDYRIHLWVLTV